MKTKLLFVLLVFNYVNSFSQIDFLNHIINNNAENATIAFAIDLDGDNDIDIISAHNNTEIVWYENTDGLGSFGIPQVITTAAMEVTSIYAIDLDNDGDIDILSASHLDNKIAWYENLDGLGNFGAQQIITTNVDSPFTVFAKDIDGDGFVDVLSASSEDSKVAWYRNIDGQANFGTQQIITTAIFDVRTLLTLDVDNDGDLDVIAAGGGLIAWCENLDGSGSFGSPQTITTNVFGTLSIFIEDLDNDGYLDLISASYFDKTIAWYKNANGQGSFEEQQIITTNADGASTVFAVDLDLDGDIDVISSSFLDNKIAWYENTDGQGNFSEQIIITDEAIGAVTAFASDFDLDGDFDVLAVSYSNNTINWFENLTILGLDENNNINITLYPNPIQNILIIENNSSIVINTIKVYDVMGRLVLHKIKPTNQIDVSNLVSGILFVKIETDKGLTTKRIIKE